MAKVQFRRDSKGVEKILRSADVAQVIHDQAEQVAIVTRALLPFDAKDGVVVDDYTTDRAASSVTIRDGRGKAQQAKSGVLTRAASQAGLEVRPK